MPEELRPRAVPKPPAGPGNLSQEQLPGDGRPPMKRGAAYMTDFTKQQLKAVGWKDGDPIPGDLGQRLQEIQREVTEERQAASWEGSAEAANWKPVEPSFVNIEELPKAKRDEIEKYLQEYKQEIAQNAQDERQLAAVDASIPENIQGPQRDAMRQQIIAGDAAMAAREARKSESYAIDDRKTVTSAVTPTTIPVPEGKVFAGSIGQPLLADKIVQAKPQPSQPVPEPVTEAPTANTTPHTNCQRCHWPSNVPFEIKPTDSDKQTFMASLLGLKPFEKRYSLLGGNMTVYFRSLTTADTAILQTQLGAMVRSGEVQGDAEYWANLNEFRLVLSVKRVDVGTDPVYEFAGLRDWEAKHPPVNETKLTATAIPRLQQFFYETVAVQEPIRRVFGARHQEFQRLVEALETMTDEPDFWTGIELPG